MSELGPKYSARSAIESPTGAIRYIAIVERRSSRSKLSEIGYDRFEGKKGNQESLQRAIDFPVLILVRSKLRRMREGFGYISIEEPPINPPATLRDRFCRRRPRTKKPGLAYNPTPTVGLGPRDWAIPPDSSVVALAATLSIASTTASG